LAVAVPSWQTSSLLWQLEIHQVFASGAGGSNGQFAQPAVATCPVELEIELAGRRIFGAASLAAMRASGF